MTRKFWRSGGEDAELSAATPESEQLTARSVHRVGQNHKYTVYIRYIHNIIGREITNGLV
jgi:hypothetical protein